MPWISTVTLVFVGAAVLTALIIAPGMLTVLTDEPQPGIAFVSSEGRGDRQHLGFYGYFFGDGCEEGAAGARPEWETLLRRLAQT